VLDLDPNLDAGRVGLAPVGANYNSIVLNNRLFARGANVPFNGGFYYGDPWSGG
jgi:hypothetical protein